VKQRIDCVAMLLVLGSSSLAVAQQPPSAETAPPQQQQPAGEAPAEGEQPAAPADQGAGISPAEAAAAGEAAPAEGAPAVEEAAPEEAAEPKAAPAPSTGDEIIVTGSRIKRSSAFGASAPVEIIDRKQLEYSGATNLADVVQYLTVSQGAGFQGGVGGPGTVSINLRGLGQGATLVLLNGRRLPPSGGGIATHFEDIGTIPLAAVDHIEILKGGASAIYGSDAIGGVVNIVTRRKVDGARIEGDLQATTSSFDARGGTISGVVGANSERGRVMLSMQYGQTNELAANKRDWTKRSTAFINTQGQPGSYIVGTGVMADPNCSAGPASSLVMSATGTLCGFNTRDYTSLVGAGERANAFASGEFDLTKHTTIFTELLVSRLRADGISVPSFPILPPFPVIPANHVDNPFGQDVRLIGRPFGVADGPLRNSADDDTLRGLVGLKGDLEDAARDTIFESWEWELSASMGQSRYHNIINDNLRPQLQQALNSCSNPGDLSKCFNPFYSAVLGTGTPNSDSVKNAIKGQDTNLTDHALQTYTAGMSGHLFELPGGDVGIAFGTEIRREWRSSDNDHDSNQFSYGALLGGTDALAVRNVYSGYAELRWPFYDGIELQTAGRLERYTDINRNAPSPSVGLTVTPGEIAGRENVAPALRKLQFRGHATEAYRAPTLYQSFPGSVVVAQPFTQPGMPLPAYIGVQNFGNAGLKPERALAISAGFMWAPIDEIGLFGDFWTYNYKDRILVENATDIVNRWFGRGGGTVPMLGKACPTDPHIVADADCNLQSVNVKQINTPGSLVTNGIDFGAMVNLTGATFGGDKEAFGTISFGAQGTYTLTYDLPYSQMLKDAINDGVKCDGTADTSACHVAGNRNATNAAPPIPRWRVNFPVTWSYDGHGAAVITHFTSSVIDDAYAANHANEKVALPTMKGLATLDLQYGYTLKDFIGKELTMRIGAYNLFDAAPPAAVGSALNVAGFDPELYDPRGRMVYAKLISQF
jgi:iron complex outermembrane receptor protein